jgi:HSP20 family molecular chaperone IbpA
MDKEKIDVEANENAVTISGEYFKQVEETNPYRIYSFNGYGSFLKTVPLPENADAKKIETIKDEDNLIIKIPKK